MNESMSFRHMPSTFPQVTRLARCLFMAGRGEECRASATRVTQPTSRQRSASFAAIPLSTRCGGRYERFGRGSRRPTSDRRCNHANWRPAVATSRAVKRSRFDLRRSREDPAGFARPATIGARGQHSGMVVNKPQRPHVHSILGLAAVLVFALAPPEPYLFAIGKILVLSGYLFGRMTIEIDHWRCLVWLGPGLFRRTIDTTMARSVALILDALKVALASGKRVEIRGFGSFAAAVRPARTSRNPRTGVPLYVPAKRTVRFRPGLELRSRVIGGASRGRPQAYPASTETSPVCKSAQ